MRNRKNQPVGVRFGPALKALVLCLFVGGAAIGYVNQKNQVYVLAEQLKNLEVRLEQLQRENQEKAKVLAINQTHSELDARVREMNLGLGPPQPDKIIRLVESPVGEAGQTGPQLYAEKAMAGEGAR